MEMPINEFVTVCYNLGKELLNKDKLTEREEEFLKQLDIVGDYIESYNLAHFHK